MSRFPNEEVIALVRDLVRKLTHFEDDSEPFAHCVNFTVSRLARADTMSFVNRKEMDAAVSGLAEKFRFHGFGPQADDLSAHYALLVPEALTKARLDDRLNALKFLVCLSESPTKYFLENPGRKRPVEREERIDWSAYLREGIEQWSPTYTSSSDGWTNDSGEEHVDRGVENAPVESPKFAVNVETLTERPHVEYRELRRTLAESIQSDWFTKDNMQEIPESTNVDARISFHWDEYVEHASHGLLAHKSNVLSEYKVMREVIWQLWRPHTSTCFALVGNKLLPKENVSISSVRPTAFKAFAREFLPYIDTLQFFRDFRKSLSDESEIFKPPGTYFSYNQSLDQIIAPFFKHLIELENEVRQQKTIMTLLKLASKLRDIFDTVAIVKRIHDEVVIDFKSNSPTTCATTLLSRLHYGLLNCATSKKEFDVYLTLYVASLFRYFQIINWWFNNDSLVDSFDEFIVINGNATESTYGKFSTRIDSQSQSPYGMVCFSDSVSDSEPEGNDNNLRFFLRPLDNFAAQDSILTIIATEVTQIGKNIRHLHTLHKLHLLNTKATSKLYHDFTGKLLRRISDYFKRDTGDSSTPSDSDEQVSYKFPAMCPDYVKYPTDMDRLENLVDTSDGFLMEAFKPFFTEKPKADRDDEKTLYERISETTKTLFPIEQMLVGAFLEVFQDRYANSGYIVRDLLFKEYRIEEHFDLLGHLFLFRDDLLSPWYRRLFQRMERGTHFDSDIWLTAHLHDVLMDAFPSLYERCTVKASDMWNFYRDPLKACGLVTIEYCVDWPISMIIRRDQIEMYKHIFQFVLQIKWALYTLNHMYFSEIEPVVQISKQHKAVTILLRRLKVYRFWLINEFSKIQHYVLGNLCASASAKFRSDLKEACNLDTLFSSHGEFISDTHDSFVRFKDHNHDSYGFNYLLYLVTKLHLMWNDLKSVDDRELVKFEKAYKMCHNSLETVIYPENVNVMY